jgi:NAD(P)-dependent dehydrogenase (short-subunit alcohol dehydrogenase family)
MNNSKAKNILVTGASKGIGKSIAKLLALQNHNVYIIARNEDALKKTAIEIGAKGYFVADLTQSDNCKSVIDKIITQAGSIDILINNAGGYVYSPIDKTKENDIENIINLNIKAPYILSKYAVENMKKNNWGRIINIGSISGVVGEANASLYSMTKSAFLGFSKALALELATDNITVNTINPGWVETELAENAIEESDFTIEEELEMIPQRRFIQPDEIANLVNYLISEDAKGMTGQSISLCAGLSAG